MSLLMLSSQALKPLENMAKREQFLSGRMQSVQSKRLSWSNRNSRTYGNNEAIRQLILQNKDSGTLKKYAQSQGMKTLREDGVKKVMMGITTVEELLSTTQEDE